VFSGVDAHTCDLEHSRCKTMIDEVVFLLILKIITSIIITLTAMFNLE